MPASRPRMLSGMVWFQIVPRKTAEIMSAAPARAKKRMATQIVGRQAGQARCTRRTPRRPARWRDRGGGPARSSRRAPSRPARRRSRRSRASRAGAGCAEDVLGQRREQHDRHREQHRDDVDEVGAEQVHAAEGVAQALRDARAGWAARSRRRAGSAASRRTSSRRRTGRRCRPGSTSRRRPRPRARRRSPGRRARPTCMPRLLRALAATISSCRTVRGSSASREGRCRADAEASSPDDQEDLPEPRVGGEGVDREPGRERRLGDAGPDQQEPAVDVVGERAAVEAEDDQRDQLHQADGTDRQVGAGELVDLEGDGDVGHHPAEVEDGAGDQEQAEVTMLPERPDVHPERAQTCPPTHDAPLWTARQEARGANVQLVTGRAKFTRSDMSPHPDARTLAGARW